MYVFKQGFFFIEIYFIVGNPFLFSFLFKIIFNEIYFIVGNLCLFGFVYLVVLNEEFFVRNHCLRGYRKLAVYDEFQLNISH